MTRSRFTVTAFLFALLWLLPSWVKAEAPRPACGRVSTESGVLVSTSDRTSQGTIYWVVGYGCDTIPFYTGVGNDWLNVRTAQLSVSVSGSSGDNKWILAYRCAGPAICLGLSPAWTSDTNPGSGAGTAEVTTQNGVPVNAVDVSGICPAKLCTIVGLARLSGTNVTEDSAGGSTSQVGGKRFLCNVYNLRPRHIRVIDTTDTWDYGTNTLHPWNNSTANRVEFLSCSADILVEANFNANIYMDNTAEQATIALGVDSTTARSGNSQEAYINLTGGGAAIGPINATYRGTPGLGYHYIQALERAIGGTVTFLGDNGGTSQSGIYVTIQN